MKISNPFLNNPVLKKVKTNYLAAKLVRASHDGQDSFVMSPETRLNIESKKILSKSKKFDIQDYNSLSKLDKSVLRSTSADTKEAAEKSLEVGLAVKDHLDKIYGENNYVFVSIGTSPSGVGRVLEFMGVETKYLPISGLSSFYNNDSYKDFSYGFPAYKTFLEEQVITDEQIDSSNKAYLFFDYTRTGRSLEIFKNMMREYFDVNSQNAQYRSFDYECYSSSAKKIDPAKYAVDYVLHYIEGEKIAAYAGVPHLPVWELDKVGECKNFESEKAKKFNFLIIDELSKKKLLKYNPANKNSL